MVLSGPNGARFALRILRYEFPDGEDDEWDSNWLVVAIDVATPRGSWKATAPSLLTWEAASLADWLRSCADDSASSELGFIEPNLRFQLTGRSSEHVALRVHFALEFRPPWDPGYEQAKPDWVDLTGAPDDVLVAVASVESDLSRFPERTRGRMR